MMKTTAFIILLVVSLASAAVKRQTYYEAESLEDDIDDDDILSWAFNHTRVSGLVKPIKIFCTNTFIDIACLKAGTGLFSAGGSLGGQKSCGGDYPCPLGRKCCMILHFRGKKTCRGRLRSCINP